MLDNINHNNAIRHFDTPVILLKFTRSHPEMVSDMSRVTLNSDLSKIPFVHF